MSRFLLIVIFMVFSSSHCHAHDLDEDELGFLKQSLQQHGILNSPTPVIFARYKLHMRSASSASSEYIPPVTEPPSAVKVFFIYVKLGFDHILPKGLDHILFILGLFLFSARLKPLLYQVTAFTLAHSITLALSIYGVFSLPSHIVEPLIALSIVYVAFENIVKTQSDSNKSYAWRPLVVFAFGLLHGLGFAGVLSQLGLPQGDYLLGLLAFNIGVELGQLAVIAMAWLLVFRIYRCNWYANRIIIPCSIFIALVGLYWSIERIFLN
jgi:hydrogenase/urease accessory protein HupE